MESLLHKDPSLTPSKQANSKRKTHHHQHHPFQHQVAARLPPNIISRQSSCNFAPPPHVQLEMVQLAALAAGGVFLNHHNNPNNKQFSHSLSLPPILPTYYQHHYHQHQPQQQQQPPLLPLPVASKPTIWSIPPPALSRRHSLATPMPRKQPNKTKAAKNPPTATATTTKKKPAQNTKKENKQFAVVEEEPTKETEKKPVDDDQIVWPAKGAGPGPDPGTLPKEFMTRVLVAADLNKKKGVPNTDSDEKLTAKSDFINSNNNLISPPPSSLPLPKFTMPPRNKLSCHAEAAAAEVDTGATDNLRRLLKLR